MEIVLHFHLIFKCLTVFVKFHIFLQNHVILNGHNCLLIMLVLFVIIVFGFQIPEEEAVSPTELAKEYMGSRPSKVSPSTLSLRSQILQEDTTLSTEPYSKKLSMALLASRPSIHSSQIAEHSDNGYMTPRPRGRSALYKMSRSPYFNVHKTTNIRVCANACRPDTAYYFLKLIAKAFMLS